VLADDDGTFWMCFDDFVEHFASINVCMIQNWNEIRIKGKFVKVNDKEDENITPVVSRWYYKVEIRNRTLLNIGIH
jgi:calpain-15